ncbi:MAG: hypothetical protein IH588_02080 [Anaerolineales bacterium]|nr:hypothetical protein [Anaerolineales bacterium]
MSLDELLEIIQKSNFRNLLNKHGFRIVYQEHEARGGIQDSCSIGYESSNCKLGFHWGAEISAGMLARSSDWEMDEWVDLGCITSYLKKTPIRQAMGKLNQAGTPLPYKERLISDLSELADKVVPLFEQLVEMFQDQAEISQWKPELDAYIKEDTLSRYRLK